MRISVCVCVCLSERGGVSECECVRVCTWEVWEERCRFGGVEAAATCWAKRWGYEWALTSAGMHYYCSTPSLEHSLAKQNMVVQKKIKSGIFGPFFFSYHSKLLCVCGWLFQNSHKLMFLLTTDITKMTQEQTVKETGKTINLSCFTSPCPGVRVHWRALGHL